MRYLNEKSGSELRAIDIVNRERKVFEISKMIQRKMIRAKDEEYLGDLLEPIVALSSNFDQRIRAGLPRCWDFQGNLLPWEQY